MFSASRNIFIKDDIILSMVKTFSTILGYTFRGYYYIILEVKLEIFNILII